jgi:hypothetical protein
MSGMMVKTPSWHLEAADDRWSVTSMRKISFTIALERKVVETAMMMQRPQTW